MISAFPFGEANEQGREMVRGDIVGAVRDWCIRMPILVVRIHGFDGGTVPAGAAGADLRKHTDLSDLRHNISSNDTAESVRDDRDGQGGTGVPYRPRPGPPRHGNRPEGGVPRAEYHGGTRPSEYGNLY